MKTPTEILTAAYGKLWADSIVRVLRTANYIIVPKGAIGRAQDDAVLEYVAANDNDLGWVCPVGHEQCIENCGSYCCGN